MFGYITPEKPEMKIKEYDLYRAVYCGICKTIGRKNGLIPRTTVTYDSAFMALLHTSISGESISFDKEPCILHPVSKRCCAKSNSSIDYAADMNILLAYYNLKDKWNDDKSIPSAALCIALKRPFAAVRRGYASKCEIYDELIKKLEKLEKEKCSSMDMAAEPFAKMLEEVMDPPGDAFTGSSRESLRWLGYNAGKWIYILDAFDDLDKDIANGSYNPLVFQFNYKDQDLTSFCNEIKDRVKFNLTYSLSQIAKSFDVMDIKSNSGIIENIIYLGMLHKTDSILNKGRCKKVGQSL